MKEMHVKTVSGKPVAYSYIRFSTPDQEMGDSERRQLALAKEHCNRNGLQLSEETFADRGVSGFHGKHRENGALGRLLKAAKPGDVLLIEDCDRWSREDPLEALIRLREQVRRGVEVVFMRTGTRVTQDNFEDMSVIVPNFFSSLLPIKRAPSVGNVFGRFGSPKSKQPKPGAPSK